MVMHDRTRDAARMEKLLEDASIKLSAVASNVTGVSARAMLSQLVAGNTDAVALADLAKGKLRRKIPDLAEALTGHFDDHHALLVSELLAALDEADAVLARIDAALEVEMAPWAVQLALLQTIPGIGIRAAQTIIAETGGDMSRFPTAAALASWAGVCPGVHESAGRRGPARRRHGDKWLCSTLVEAAHSVARSRNTYLASQYAGIAGRRGSPESVTATRNVTALACRRMSRWWVLIVRPPRTGSPLSELTQSDSGTAGAAIAGAATVSPVTRDVPPVAATVRAAVTTVVRRRARPTVGMVLLEESGRGGRRLPTSSTQTANPACGFPRPARCDAPHTHPSRAICRAPRRGDSGTSSSGGRSMALVAAKRAGIRPGGRTGSAAAQQRAGGDEDGEEKAEEGADDGAETVGHRFLAGVRQQVAAAHLEPHV
jgi:transposase